MILNQIKKIRLFGNCVFKKLRFENVEADKDMFFFKTQNFKGLNCNFKQQTSILQNV